MIIMKNIIKLSCALAAALCVISCNEKIGSEIPELGDYITVSTDVASHTKAGYEGTSVLPENFFISIDQTGTDKDYERTMSRVESSNKYIFPNNEKLKWASSDYSTVNIKAITTPSCYNKDNGSVSLSQDQSTEAGVLANDLIGAWTGNGIEINSGNVVVHFNHLMSKLYVKYNTSNVTVSSLSLNDICINGMFSFESGAYTSVSTGNINMYHDTSEHTAEAIFFPYASGSNPKLSVSVQGQRNPITTEISLAKVGGTFQPGKRYIMNVTITGSTIEGAEVTVSEWTPDFTTITTPGKKVLWVGTSIPQGNAYLNYPALVDDALTCTIKNNAVGGSLVLKEINADWVTGTTQTDWDTHVVSSYDGESYSLRHLQAGGLAQSHDQAEMYRSKLKNITGVTDTWVEEQMRKIKSLSYESVILPFIDPDQGGDYDVVILDHGFNDLQKLAFEAGGHMTAAEYEDWGDVWGYTYLMNVKSKLIDLEQYKSDFNSNPNLTADGRTGDDSSYIIAMSKIIEAIKATNPNVKIIIGNYFALYSPWVKTTFPDFNENFTSLLCYNNEALAGMWDLDIVNVYKYLDIPENMFWNPAGTDYSKFCPDGVHPSNPAAVGAIAEIYIDHLDGIVGSRGQDHTSANTSSVKAGVAAGIDTWNEEEF